jgi:hypothetical protein
MTEKKNQLIEELTAQLVWYKYCFVTRYSATGKCKMHNFKVEKKQY